LAAGAALLLAAAAAAAALLLPPRARLAADWRKTVALGRSGVGAGRLGGMARCGGESGAALEGRAA
jgi:hypothetical protein